MKTYYFITLTGTAPDLNPGSHLISDGVKHLVRMADPYAILQDISIFSYNAKHWEAMLSNASGIFLCGNPRFDPSETYHYWTGDLLEFMQKAHTRGIKVGDLFLGSAYPFPLKSVDVMAAELMFSSRNINALSRISSFDLLITRDAISQAICSSSPGGSTLMPDSTFWAKDYYGIVQGEKLYNCVTVPSLNSSEAVLSSLHTISQTLGKLKQTYILCHEMSQYCELKSLFPDSNNILLIYDARSLLNFYSHVDKLVSCRLHGSIPALSLGARVMNIAMDSRSNAFDMFGFKSLPYTSLKKREHALSFNNLPVSQYPTATQFILSFKKHIMEDSHEI